MNDRLSIELWDEILRDDEKNKTGVIDVLSSEWIFRMLSPGCA